MNRILTQVKESIEFLKEKLKKEKSSTAKQRIQALYLIASKQVTRQSHISRVLGVHRNTVSSWLKTYEENGFDSMLEIKQQPGRPTSLTMEAISGLKERLNRAEGFASYEEARQFLSKEHSIELSYSRVHKLVRYEMGATQKSPRPSNPEKKKKK